VLIAWAFGCGAAQPVPSAGAPLVAVADPALHARLGDCEPLVYSEPPPAGHADRGPHVRAASGLARLGDGLLIAQDDMSILVLRDSEGRLSTRPLPARDGQRAFDAEHGNLHLKPDLEACASLSGDRVVCFGSGTMAERSWIALVSAREVRWSDAEPFYASLRQLRALCGPQLNLEGAVVVGDRLRLFHRGNGVGDDRHSGYADLGLAAFEAWLAGAGPLPEPVNLRTVDLGSVEGVGYGFTAATAAPGDAIVFLAGAEASTSPLHDGQVLGVQMGVMDEGGLRITAIEDESGQPTTVKLEGLVLDLTDPQRAWAVTDVDATDTPASLCEIHLTGPWTRAVEP